jgi:branched-chain amino acid transport system ATP-binding protein/nonpolar-amino-acid-transporting ATPase
MTVFSTRQLSAGYGKVPVLFDVDIDVKEGESVSIIGANGAGKSTLVRAICGLIPCMRGSILKDTTAIEKLPAYRRADLGIAVVLEGRHLFGELSVEANLRLAEAKGAERTFTKFEYSVDEVLDLFPFMRDRRNALVEVLSGGEQQMVAIGRALLLKPELLVLDEPSTGLAPKVVRDIVRVISALRDRGMSLLLIEQNVAVAVESSDRAYVLSVGKIVDSIGAERWNSASTTEALAKTYLGG